MSWRGVTLQTRAASAAERRRRAKTSPSLAMRIRVSASRLSPSGTCSPPPRLTRESPTGCADVRGENGGMSTTETDVPPPRTGGSLAGWPEALAEGDPHGHVVARRLLAVPFRPHPSDLDTEG